MASKAVMDAVNALYETWPDKTSCPLAPTNEISSPSPTRAYLNIEYPVSSEDRIGLGDPGYFRESGGIRFIVHVLFSDGISSAATFVDGLRDLFREAELGAVTMLEVSPGVYDEKNQAGAFYAVPFVGLYRYDYEK